MPPRRLVSYIAPAAPATRRPADGDEPFLRPEIGFTPAWYRDRLGIDFGEQWHADPALRRETRLRMRDELRARFPGMNIGDAERTDAPLDILTGVHGACLPAALFGVPVRYDADNWPASEHVRLDDDAADRLEPVDLDGSAVFRRFMEQVEEIARLEGVVAGYANWQGVLNTAQRLRGEAIFHDMIEAPERAGRVFAAVAGTMAAAAERLHERQRRSGFPVAFFTVSNCLVNMVSPRQYEELLLPHDIALAERFGCMGVHNCAWTADPYLERYARVPHLGYVDMGIDSDLVRARELFPEARRALMYTPMDLATKPLDALRSDFERVADAYGPCDIVLADIETDTPDERVRAAWELCADISARSA